MPNPEIEEFAKTLVQRVRDAAVRSIDGLLLAQANSPVARRMKGTGPGAANLPEIVPDVVDEVVFSVLHAIDEGTLRFKYVCSDGREIDLTEDGLGELAGWYMGSGGWRSMYSEERYHDDFADMNS